jgi:MFS family permease
VLAIGLLDFSLEQAIVVPALPAIEQRYHASPSATAWILTGFLLALGISTPLAGRLGDRHGKRLVLMGSLGLFVIGAIVCGVAGTIGVLIAGRVIQGLGGGVGPLAVGLVRDNLSRERVHNAIGLLIGLAGVGGVVGFLACGVLIKYVSVPSIFWLLAAVGAGCIVSVLLTVEESPVRAGGGVDWFGASLLATALAGVLLAISEGNTWHWGSAREVALFAGSLSLLMGFAARELTTREPLIQLDALACRPIAGANVAVFAVGYALLVGYTLVPLFGGLPKATGYGLGLSTIQISLMLAPGAVGGLLGGLVSGRIVSGSGARLTAATGVACGLTAYMLFVLLPRTVPAVALLMIPLGLGTSLAIAATVNLIALSAREEQTAVLVGVNSVIRAVGSALGAQIAVAIWTAAAKQAPNVPRASGITNAFVMALIATGIAALAILLIPARRSDPTLLAAGHAAMGPGDAEPKPLIEA